MNVAPRFEKLAPYAPNETSEALAARLGVPPERILKLDANENPYGPSPKALAAVAGMRAFHLYPDPDCRDLCQALSAYTGAPAECLMAGAGADELISLLLRVLLEPGDRVLVCPPTFTMYAIDAGVQGGEVVSAPKRADFSLDLDAIRAAVAEQRPKALFIPSPGNPDGWMITPAEMEALLALPTLVVLDEAYIEFADGSGRLGGLSWIARAPEYPNLAVLRTFSKWAGLAGLRIGYGAFPGWLLSAMWKAKPPYNVTSVSFLAALASLEDLDTLAERVELIKRERQRLFERLSRMPYLTPHPSQANFIYCTVNGRSAGGLKDWLAEQGILVRAYPGAGRDNALRITVGRPEDSDRLLEALEREP